jgi:MoaA/NifB/PqqE/SkfB family radical SAM enzyme
MIENILKRLFKGKKEKPFSAWQIELTTRCPLQCKMCIRAETKDWQFQDMPFEDFKKILPYLKDVENVILEGWGESLLYKDLSECIRLIKKEGPEVGFVTSGKGLTEDRVSELIEAGLDFIGFSIAGTQIETHANIRANSYLSEILNAIRFFTEEKKRKDIARPKMHFVFLMLRNNIHEIPNLPAFAEESGIKEVFLTNIIHITNLSQNDQKVFFCETRMSNIDTKGNENVIPAKAGIQSIRELDSRLHGNDGLEVFSNQEGENYFDSFLKEAEANAKRLRIKLKMPPLLPIDVSVCEENPLRNLYISSNGEVSPCVYLYPPLPTPFKRIFCGQEYWMEKVSFGNIFKESFSEIWHGKSYENFRNCFMDRKDRSREFYFSVWDAPNARNFQETRLPEPPGPCKTCHKILGF